MNGCRMIIGLDGAHLTGKFGGVMLSATGIDAQNGVFPLCMMICMGETEENWFMMLKELRKRIPDMAGLTFISDRMKGILESVKRLYPLSNHRYCLRHLYKNFLTKGFRKSKTCTASLAGCKGIQISSLGGGHARNSRDISRCIQIPD